MTYVPGAYCPGVGGWGSTVNDGDRVPICDGATITTKKDVAVPGRSAFDGIVTWMRVSAQLTVDTSWTTTFPMVPKSTALAPWDAPNPEPFRFAVEPAVNVPVTEVIVAILLGAGLSKL